MQGGKQMARPIKCTRVEFFPKNTYFIPLGKKGMRLKKLISRWKNLKP
jgi:predicted DNA-binding protein (UPF0251 family)